MRKAAQTIRWALPVLLSLMASASWARNDDDFYALDFALKMGITTGSISRTDPTTQAKDSYTFGGIPVAVAYTHEFSRKWTAQGEFHFVIDLENIQVTRTGFDAVLGYHLFGGARRLVSEYGPVTVLSREPYNFSLLLRGGFHRYTASSQAAAVSLSGSVFDTCLGFQYRADFSDRTAFSLEVFQTLMSLSASLDRISTSQTLVLFNWRFLM